MKVMAIDYGDAHTGIAISDYTETLAGYSDTLHSRRQEEVLSGIQRLIAEHGVQLLVLGYPRNMDGTEGPRAEKCAAFGETLRQATGLEVILWDERRTYPLRRQRQMCIRDRPGRAQAAGHRQRPVQSDQLPCISRSLPWGGQQFLRSRAARL